jgi:thiamine pyrophosphate-dependent acetolactate synthase large subunit-like protein
VNGAAAVLKALERQGVTTVFGHPGGAIMPIYDALYDSPIQHVLVRHEQAGAHAADAYYRASGRVGVCFATSGPGATNLVTGLATAYMDSSAVVAVTGNVPLSLIGTDAFQEADVTGITLPVTKHNYLVKDVATCRASSPRPSTSPAAAARDPSWSTCRRTSSRRPSRATSTSRSTCPATARPSSATPARSGARPRRSRPPSDRC